MLAAAWEEGLRSLPVQEASKDAIKREQPQVRSLATPSLSHPAPTTAQGSYLLSMSTWLF